MHPCPTLENAMPYESPQEIFVMGPVQIQQGDPMEHNNNDLRTAPTICKRPRTMERLRSDLCRSPIRYFVQCHRGLWSRAWRASACSAARQFAVPLEIGLSSRQRHTRRWLSPDRRLAVVTRSLILQTTWRVAQNESCAGAGRDRCP